MATPAAAFAEEQEDRLRRVRALLTQAERTNFPEEAKTFSEKAAELMDKWSITEAMLGAVRVDDGTVDEQKIRIPANEYRQPKIDLLVRLAEHFNCKLIMFHQRYTCDTCMEGLGSYGVRTGTSHRLDREGRECKGKAVRTFELGVTGFERDRRFVETLYTSLLLQSEREFLHPDVQERMREECPQAGHRIAWRNSFMNGYVEAIGWKLRSARRRAEAEVAAEQAVTEETVRSTTAIVLADRRLVVQRKYAELHPRVGKGSRGSAGNHRGSGYGHGRTAGERADIGQPRTGSGSGAGGGVLPAGN